MTMVPIFVISLATSGKRRESIAGQLRALGMEFEIVDAVDGRSLSEAQLESVYDPDRATRILGRPMSRGEVGCALSHQRVYQRICDERIPLALVLEDDAKISEGLSRLHRFLTQTRTPEFDVLSLHARGGWLSKHDTINLAGHTCYRVVSHGIWHTVGYAISATGAGKLRVAGRVNSLADWPVSCKRLRFYAAFPDLVGHDAEESTLTMTRKELIANADGLTRTGGYALTAWRASGLYYLLNASRYRDFRDYLDREGLQPWSRFHPHRKYHFYVELE